MLHVEVQRGEPHIPVDAKRGVIVVDVHPTELTNVEGRRPTRAAGKHTRTHTEKQRETGPLASWDSGCPLVVIAPFWCGRGPPARYAVSAGYIIQGKDTPRRHAECSKRSQPESVFHSPTLFNPAPRRTRICVGHARARHAPGARMASVDAAGISGDTCKTVLRPSVSSSPEKGTLDAMACIYVHPHTCGSHIRSRLIGTALKIELVHPLHKLHSDSQRLSAPSAGKREGGLVPTDSRV